MENGRESIFLSECCHNCRTAVTRNAVDVPIKNALCVGERAILLRHEKGSARAVLVHLVLLVTHCPNRFDGHARVILSAFLLVVFLLVAEDVYSLPLDLVIYDAVWACRWRFTEFCLGTPARWKIYSCHKVYAENGYLARGYFARNSLNQVCGASRRTWCGRRIL